VGRLSPLRKPIDRRGGDVGRRASPTLKDWLAVAIALAALALLPPPVQAQEPVQVSVEPQPGYVRIALTWPDGLSGAVLEPTVEIENGVLVVRFPRPIALDPQAIAGALPARVALARLDPGGSTLRLALAAPVRVHLSRSYNMVGLDLVDPSAPDPDDIVSPELVRLQQESEAAAARAAVEAARTTGPPPRLPLGVRVAEASDFARIVFGWTEPTAFDLVRTGDGVELRFERDAAPDIARLRIDPPRGVVNAEARHANDRLQVAITLAPGMTARAWSDGTGVILDVMAEGADIDSVAALEALAVALHAGADPATLAANEPAPAAAPQPAPGLPDVLAGEPEGAAETAHAATPSAADAVAPLAEIPTEAVSEPEPLLPPVEDLPLAHTRAFDSSEHVAALTRDPYEGIEDRGPAPEIADPTPESGVVRATVASSGADAIVTFAWAAPVGAAAFRRADAVWLVFDVDAELNIDEIRRAAARHLGAARAVRGEAFTAVRIAVGPATQVSVVRDGATWTFAFGEAAAAPPRPVGVERRADDNTAPYLFAALPSVTAVHAVPDEEAGDSLIAVTALGPPQGLAARRTFLEITALPSAHGLGFERAADGVTARAVPGEGVVLERARGMALSGAAPVAAAAPEVVAALAPEELPGFIDFAAWTTSPAEFTLAHDALARRIATGNAPALDRIALARLLVGQELGLEALGVLKIALSEDPRLLDDATFRALRGAANVMAGRFKEAETDWNAAPIARDIAAAPWRGYVATRFRDWREARRQFAEGGPALVQMRADWRGRFLAASAESALELNDLAGARRMIDEAYAEELPPEVLEQARLMEARFYARSGDPARATELAGVVARSGYPPLEVAALYEITKLRQDQGLITAEQAVDELDALRYRWRGDEIELEIVRELGAMYYEAGELRRGMQLIKTAASRYSDNPLARQLYGDMSDAFRRLFLDGESDALDPIEALALWYEFNDLTPVGADGDRMLRRLADRLIDFDLLEQAAELLAHQVDNRLRGVARAQVATDLAAIYLMDRRPEDALNALRRTRIAGSPTGLVAERRLLEARALADLDRHAHALELLAIDRSEAAQRLKADVAWRARMWPEAAALLEAAAAEAWREEGALPREIQSQVLRAAVAFRLARDGESVRRLVARFGPKMGEGPHAASWRTVTAEPEVDGVVLRDLASRIAETDTLDAFLDEFRARRADHADAVEAVESSLRTGQAAL
jgi:hypothetical protein